MTDSKKIRRKNLWDSLGEKRQKEIIAEYEEIQRWDREQREKREAELKRKGEWKEYGLDANQEKFADIIAEKKRRFREWQKKYGFDRHE